MKKKEPQVQWEGPDRWTLKPIRVQLQISSKAAVGDRHFLLFKTFYIFSLPLLTLIKINGETYRESYTETERELFQ